MSEVRGCIERTGNGAGEDDQPSVAMKSGEIDPYQRALSDHLYPC